MNNKMKRSVALNNKALLFWLKPFFFFLELISYFNKNRTKKTPKNNNFCSTISTEIRNILFRRESLPMQSSILH